MLMNLAVDDPESHLRVAAFAQGLGELGWTIGRNVDVEYRWAAGEVDRPAATSGRGPHPTGRERIFRVFERTGPARAAGSEADRARAVHERRRPPRA